MSTEAVSENPRGNAADRFFTFLNGTIFGTKLLVSFFFPSLQTSDTLPSLISRPPSELDCFLGLLFLQLMKGKDHLKANINHQKNYSFTKA